MVFSVRFMMVGLVHMSIDGIKGLGPTFFAAVVFLGLCVLLCVAEPRFGTRHNMINLGLQAAPLILAALAQAIVVVSGGIDLSQGSVVALAGVIGVSVAVETDSAFAGWAGVVAVAALLGAINGVLVAWVRVPAFIVTAGMLASADGLAFLFTGGLPIEFPPVDYSWFGRGFVGDIPASIPTTLAISGVVFWIMHRTRVGRSIYLAGDNPSASHIVGINPKRCQFYAFMIAGVLTGFAAVLLTGRIDSAPPSLYPGLPFEAIAAVAIGGIAMTGGEGAIWRAVVGVIPVTVAVNGLNLLGVGNALQLVTIGVVTVVVVAIQSGSNVFPTRNHRA